MPIPLSDLANAPPSDEGQGVVKLSDIGGSSSPGGVEAAPTSSRSKTGRSPRSIGETLEGMRHAKALTERAGIEGVPEGVGGLIDMAGLAFGGGARMAFDYMKARMEGKSIDPREMLAELSKRGAAGQQAGEQLADVLGIDKPENKTEASALSMGRAGVAAAVSGPGRAPANFAGGVIGESARRYVEKKGGGTVAQSTAALLGGLVGGTVGNSLERATASLRLSMADLHEQVSPKSLDGAIGTRKPGPPSVENVTKYLQTVMRMVNPEGFGKEAKEAAAIMGSKIAERVHETASYQHQSEAALRYWTGRSKQADSFMGRIVSEVPEQAKSELAPFKRRYGWWAEQIRRQNIKSGNTKGPQTLAEIFMKAQPGDNPENVMLAHQYEADAATMTGGVYEDLERFGLAKKVEKPVKPVTPEAAIPKEQKVPKGAKLLMTTKDKEIYSLPGGKRFTRPAGKPAAGPAEPAEAKKPEPPPWRYVERSAPNGDKYFVHEKANAILTNALDSHGLWGDPRLRGEVYRGAMAVKNTIVPLKLAVSLFHPLHVFHIDNAAYIARAFKSIAGAENPAKAFFETMKLPGRLARGTTGILSPALWDNPRYGGKLRAAFNNGENAKKLNDNDQLLLQYMLEGGFVPNMSARYRAIAEGSFTSALRQHAFVKAAFKAPSALVATLQKPLFEWWIPNLKTAAFANETKLALTQDPSLASNTMRRMLRLRQIQKSVDNRFGEMNYETLFWNPMLKDLTVANTLSLGWQMGFIREYGGGAMDLGQFATKGGKITQIRQGAVDRPLFVAAYTTTALMYGGLLTWALSGKSPKDMTLQDYVYPDSGEKDPQGRTMRLSTMFYTREVASIYDHIEKEGVFSGLAHIVSSKSSGLVGMAHDAWTGMDSFGREYRDPNSPAYKQLEQTLAYTFADSLEPIAIKAIREHNLDKKEAALALAGFSPAPKYATQSKTESAIIQSFDKYVAPSTTSYEKAQYSDEYRQLREAYQRDDPKTYDILDRMEEKFQLNRADVYRIRKTLKSKQDMTERMFSRLDWSEQKRLLDGMSEAERDKYIKHSNKRHLRRHYEAPQGDE